MKTFLTIVARGVVAVGVVALGLAALDIVTPGIVALGAAAPVAASTDGRGFTDARFQSVTFDKPSDGKITKTLPPDDYFAVLCVTCPEVHLVSPKSGEVPSGGGE
jgi:hypothetical protein